MVLPSLLPATLSARHYCRHRRRPGRLLRLLELPLPSNRLGQPRPLQAHRPNQAELAAEAAAYQYGDYVLGDENCPFLYGPTDVRY